MPELRLPEEIFNKPSESQEKIPEQYFKYPNSAYEFSKIPLEKIGKEDFSEEEILLSKILNVYLSDTGNEVPPDGFFTPAYYKKYIRDPLAKIIHAINTEQFEVNRQIEEFNAEHTVHGIYLVETPEDQKKLEALKKTRDIFLSKKDYVSNLDREIKRRYIAEIRNIKGNDQLLNQDFEAEPDDVPPIILN